MLPVCQGPIGSIIIRSDDTDVLLLSVYYFSRGQLTDHLYMYAGHSGKERYIPGHLTANKIGPPVCECLPAVQPLLGCPVNRKGKKPTLNCLQIWTCYRI